MTARQEDPSLEPIDGEVVGGHQPNDLIADKYLLRHVIGIGGMGTVWAATNLDLDLDVALKVVNKGVCTDETRARLATEARAEAKVQHRGIVRVLDLGVTKEGEPFLVMERLEGRSLGDLLEDVGYIESRDAVRTMLPVIEALAYAHGRGVIHRDLKPDNIFLAENCGKIQPKLVDFGIAKLGDMPVNRRQTGRGAVVGSPGYMAPEHARGVDVDHRADIFCASLVLYEAISGKTAFSGDNYNALLRAVIEQHLEPITAFGRGDSNLSRILERGLNKNPAKRQASCLELGRELATWLLAQGETEDVTGEPLSSWWQRSASPSTDPNGRAVLARRPISSRPGRPALPSLRGMSISTAGLPPPRSSKRRIAFFALAISGFAGGFVATTAFDFFPGQSTSKGTPHAAAASTRGEADTLSAARPTAMAPTVTPVESTPDTSLKVETPQPERRSTVPAPAAVPVPRPALAARFRATVAPTLFPDVKAPPSFGRAEEASPPPGPSAVDSTPAPPEPSAVHSTPYDTDQAEPVRATPPPPSHAGNTELKDPYQ